MKIFSTTTDKALYLRNFVFGVEDSLASTVGLLSGVAAAGLAREDIILIGVILVFVEAFSMGVGSFLSERSAEEYINNRNPLRTDSKTLAGALIMFGSYVFSGIIPLWPYLFMAVESALIFSVSSALAALFLLGILSAKISDLKPIKRGFRMLIIGGFAVLIGLAVGLILGH